MNEQLKNILARFQRKVVTDPLKTTIRPDVEWQRIFLVFWICFGCIAGWSVWIYWQYAFPGEGAALVAAPVPLAKESFVPAFRAFDERLRLFEAELDKTNFPADPGLK